MARNKTPTSILSIRGSRVTEQRQGEPKPNTGWPDCHESLSNEASEIWNTLCQMLDDMGVLTVADGWQISRYCQYWEQFRQWQRVLDTIRDTDENLKRHILDEDFRAGVSKALAEVHRLETAMQKIESQYGLTPSSRAGLAVDPNRGKKPIASRRGA